MSYLLDTNVCVRLINRSSAQVLARTQSLDPSIIRHSVVTRAELLYGARKSARVSANLAGVDRFCEPLTVLPFDEGCARHYGAMRATLEQLGTPIGWNDYMIAATALAHDLVLVTHNAREFNRVVGLEVEDWEA